MRAGLLKNIVEVWELTATRDDYNAARQQWTKKTTIRAYVQQQAGSETMDNKEIFHAVKMSVQIRSIHRLTDKQRIKHQGNFFAIDFVHSEPSGQWLTLSCTRVNE